MKLILPLAMSSLAALAIRCRHYLICLALLGSVCFSVTTAFLLRFEFSIPRVEMHHLLVALLATSLIKMPVFYLMRANRGWFFFSGLRDLQRTLMACLTGSILFTVCMFLLFGSDFPRSVYIMDGLCTVAMVISLRIAVRVIREIRSRSEVDHQKNILVYGAGKAGLALAREISSNPQLRSRVVGFLDDSSNKAHESLLGIPIWPGGAGLATAIQALGKRSIVVDEILIAVPSARAEQLSAIVASCRATGVPCRTLPGIGELIHGRNLRAQVRDIRLEDLLSRKTIELEHDVIRRSLEGRCVMITGAAGSIGSELAARIAEFKPRKLILFDFAESQLYYVEQRLRSEGYGDLLVCVIGDIRDVAQLEDVVGRHGVESIFHAAAYKHVPLMEAHVAQAAINNILGTYNVAEVARRFGVKECTLISSDKAVNPTSVMGATKRAAELIVASFTGGPTKFSAVRFGNVLGSNGSVVPLFQSQLARGGPLTVTHPEVTRFFMTVREAVQLVLQASTMGKGGEIFVLDMGQPMKIYDLAKNLICLAGLTPDVDIKIEFTGLRPGEKLYEELIAEGENTVSTHHRMVKIFKGPVPNRAGIQRWVDELCLIAASNDDGRIVRHMASLIPEYQFGSQWREEAYTELSGADRVKPAARHFNAANV